MDKTVVLKKRINEIGLKVMDNEKVINELVDNNLELKIIKQGLQRILDEDKKGVKEGGEKGRRG